AIEGLLTRSYVSLVLGDDDRAAGLKLIANKIWLTYQSKIKSRAEAIGLPSMAGIDHETLNRLLDPQQGLRPEVRAVLRRKLGLPASTNAPPASTNSPAVSTNAPAAAAPK
ncbi:MAG TPA: hypothetical protein VKA67_03505, partial [Verrucomicrobiae bacterium]|nr:hypothetical protein [Verrucomicrobiae bacterium]